MSDEALVERMANALEDEWRRTYSFHNGLLRDGWPILARAALGVVDLQIENLNQLLNGANDEVDSLRAKVQALEAERDTWFRQAGEENAGAQKLWKRLTDLEAQLAECMDLSNGYQRIITDLETELNTLRRPNPPS